MKYTFEVAQSYGVKQKCLFDSKETYKFKVTLSDLNMTVDSLESDQFTFNKGNRESKEIWLVLISGVSIIPVICIFSLYIWIR